MAARSCQPFSPSLPRIYPVGITELSQQQNVALQLLIPGNHKIDRSSSLPLEGYVPRVEVQEPTLKGKNIGAVQPQYLDDQLARWYKQTRCHPVSTSKFTSPNCPGHRGAAGNKGDLTSKTVSRLCENGQLSDAVDALGVLVQRKSRLSVSLFHKILKRCLSQKNLVLGRRVHDLTVQHGYGSNTFLGNHILRMYAAWGRLQEATDVFSRVATPDVFTWSAIISAHAKHGEAEQAIQLYHEMRKSSVQPDGHVFAAALQACASAAALESGRQVHADVLGSGIQPDMFVCNCLIDMYAKCGRLEEARLVFDTSPTRNVVIWTAMIAGYVEHDCSQEALLLYETMEQEGMVVANCVTFACLVKACARIGALQQGKRLHSQILERAVEADMVVWNSLVDMYAKCGRLEEARRVFDSLPTRDVVTWNSMIAGLGQSNEGQQAIQCFHEMLRDGVQPNGTTFICLLVACSHESLVDEGWLYFNSMERDYKLMPTKQHYMCMVDLLGRSGHVDEAEKMLLSMPFDSDVVGWMSLLSACRSHHDIERGKRCFESIIRLDSQRAAAYVLMANIYADVGRWTDVNKIEKLRRLVGARRKPAKAGIEVNSQVHIFVVGEEREDIATKLSSMNLRLKEEGGHVPHTELVQKQVSEKEKEDELCGHAEKLALAYGLLNTPDGTPLLVTKNLRMCGDCHSATEILSRIEKREIIVRDAHCVHRFVGGPCCCGGRHSATSAVPVSD